MKIGIAGPILTAPLAEFLDCDVGKAPRGLGGISIVQLVKGLLRNGYRVSVYSLDQGVAAAKVLRGEQLTMYFGTYRSDHRMRDFMKVERENIRNFIIEDNPDIVNSHWTYEFALGALSSGKPVLVTLRDWAPKIFWLKLDPYRFGRLLMHFVTLIRGANFTANSPYIQRCVKRYIRKDIPVIPNGLDDREFYDGKRSLNLDQPKIVSVNNGFSIRKNVKTLFYAFKLIKMEVANCRMLLLGDEFEEGGKAEQWAKDEGVAKGVDFVGTVEHSQVLTVLRNADILIHPAKEESFGMTLLEAMAQRTPVVAGERSGAVPWVLNNGNAGILVDIHSAHDIAKVSIDLLTSNKTWQNYSAEGYQHAWKNFRLSNIVDQYVDVYKDLLSRGNHY